MSLTTADYALVVSLFSAIIALASLGWNIWSKFLYPKARLRVSLTVSVMVSQSEAADLQRPRYIGLGFTNFGPTETTLRVASVRIKTSRLPWKRGQMALINPIHDLKEPSYSYGPFSAGLPKTLTVGEQFTLYFPGDPTSIFRANLSEVGGIDVFNRTHRASRRDIRRVREDLDTIFPEVPYLGLPDSR